MLSNFMAKHSFFHSLFLNMFCQLAFGSIKSISLAGINSVSFSLLLLVYVCVVCV